MLWRPFLKAGCKKLFAFALPRLVSVPNIYSRTNGTIMLWAWRQHFFLTFLPCLVFWKKACSFHRFLLYSPDRAKLKLPPLSATPLLADVNMNAHTKHKRLRKSFYQLLLLAEWMGAKCLFVRFCYTSSSSTSGCFFLSILYHAITLIIVNFVKWMATKRYLFKVFLSIHFFSVLFSFPVDFVLWLQKSSRNQNNESSMGTNLVLFAMQ